ncbi:hypothetical protein FHG87_002029 [Trinorchestia longiramus]|nr:hypothetical protein FHG87_002029 [Trinorchestia longiramus]
MSGELLVLVYSVDGTMCQVESKSSSLPSVLRDLDQNCLLDTHSMHLLSTPALEGGRVDASCSAMCGGRAVFLFGAPSAALVVVSMDPSARHPPLPGSTDSVSVSVIKNNSLVNRLFLGFVPGVFRAGESGKVSSVCCVAVRAGRRQQQVYGVGVCGDARLRLWCLQRGDCVLVRDTAEDTAEAATAGGEHKVVGRQMADGSAVVAVWLSFLERQLLLLYRIFLPSSADSAATPVLVHVRTLYPPQHRLVDMRLTDTDVWSLWTDTNNESEVFHCPIELQQHTDTVSRGCGGLQSACMLPPPPKAVPLADPALDPKEVYLKTLFLPHTFSVSSISRALAIYGRSTTADHALQDSVEETLQQQVDNVAPQDAGPQERYDLALDLWETFYSHVLEYHQVGRKSLGLMCGAQGEVAVVCQAGVSWMVAVEALEALVAAALAAPPTQDLTQVVLHYGASSVLCGDATVAASVAGVLRCVALVHSLMDSEVAAAFVLDMAHHNHPEVVAEDVAASLLTQVVNGDEVAAMLSTAVSAVPGFTVGLRCVLQALKLDCGCSGGLSSDSKSSPRCQLWCSLVSAALHHLASSRFQLCRDLLVLQQAVLQLTQLCHFSAECVGELRSNIVQETVLLTRAYHALFCLSRAPASRPSQLLLHDIKRVLAALGLHDSASSVSPLPTSAALPSTAMCTILQQGASSLEQEGPWISSLMSAVRSFAREAWPLQDRSGSTALLEALLFCGQGSAALHYIRQVSGWCEWSLYSRHFLLGVCLLLQGQQLKAARVLQEAGEGCSSEELLAVRVGGGGDTAHLHYTLRLVRLFEVFQEPVLALRLATSALCLGQHDSAQLAQLYSVLFKHHLALGHHNEAFTALLANPDPAAQHACLRQLLVHLHNTGCLNTLVSYQYGHLTSDVVTILENRARSSDVLLSNYYHLLYAFHLQQHNYKRAASAMYECAVRVSSGLEAGSEASLKLQLKCYLACTNCLKLLPPHQAWILRPNPASVLSHHVASPPTQDKHRHIGSNAGASGRRQKSSTTVEVLELRQIYKEFDLLHARLSLAKLGTFSSIGSGTTEDADSLISLLCHGRLYKDAVKLSSSFERSLRPVVASLAAVCVSADLAADKQQNAAWLKLNNVSNVNGGWWNLLRELLDGETGRQSDLHRTAASAILDLNHDLPPWLLLSYSRRDYGGLLALLLRHGLLDASAQLAVRLLDAFTLGRGVEEFGVSSAVHSTGAPVWLPYSALDHLLLELQANSHHPHYRQLLTLLHGKLQSYRGAATTVSSDRVLLLA